MFRKVFFLYFWSLKSKTTVYNLYENADETYKIPIILKERIILQIFFDTNYDFQKYKVKIFVVINL